MDKDRRLEFHKLLVTTLGNNNVYFQPPTNVELKYPCIIYKRSRFDSNYADGKLYKGMQGYQVMIIDFDPDSEIPGRVRLLPFCRFDRHYTADNLNHDVFNVYY